MDLIRRYFVQIKAQLAGLTISQKLVIGLLGVFLVGAIFWTVAWSAKPQMVPLVEQSMTPEEINKVEMALKGKYDYQISGDKVLVPVEQAYAIRGSLAAEHNLPKSLVTAFDRVIEQNSLFTPEATNARIWNNALQTELTRYLNEFPYVENASVIISLGQQSMLGRAPVPSTASVYIKTHDNTGLNGDQVGAIADLVSGSVSGMKREDVHVIVNGQHTYRTPSDDTPMPANLLEYKRTMEDYLTAKLEAQLSNFGDVKVAVNVDPDLSSSVIQETTYDPKATVVKPIMESNTDTSSSDGTPGGGGEPGVQPNVTALAASPASSGGRGAGNTSTITHTQNQVAIGSTTKTSNVPAGVNIKALTASISLPRTYFVSLYHKQFPKEDPKTDPDDADPKFTGLIDKQLKSVHEQAKNVISAKADDQIRVDWYDDTIVMKTPAAATTTATFASGVMPVFSQYVKPGFLVLVACVALAGMFRMVRRAVPAGADDTDAGVFFASGSGGGKKGRKKGSVEQLDATEDVFGEANQGEAVLTGIELDDETLASRKMVDEVSMMIKENPENAAALVKRWLAKNK